MWTLLLLAATVRSFAHMPLGISDRNTNCYLFIKSQCKCESQFSMHNEYNSMAERAGYS